MDKIKKKPTIAGVMWKTVSEACNLACDYCYYSSCGGKPGKINRVDEDVLEKFIIEYMKIKRRAVPFAWQGGEPLLAGLDFFQKVVDLQAKHAPRNTMISNAIQTNGTLITMAWAQFFKKYNFLVGVSIDGPQVMNDRRRVTSAGGGSFNAIMRGINHLREENVDFNILTVIHEDNVSHAQELMAFFDEQNFSHVQFIPCMDFRAQDINQPPRYHISPEQYGQFLCECFDYWYNDGFPKMSIRFFDNMLADYLNQSAELCTHMEFCPTTLILEPNGDAYPCDFFIHDDYKLGNIKTHALEELIDHPTMKRFLTKKPNLPEACQSCEFLSLCHGGCPRNRSEIEPNQTEYFCESYQMIYRYADQRMQTVAENIRGKSINEYVKLGHPLPNRNDQCLCGSGKKFKQCCMKLIEA
ncbi:anaerobic sulfatase maturase [Amphibacillus sediminis]|uniref:anaerobic sulfatase maturase n=1 Tax=Amphibacillus sediminis TaxID=360185 RepID=UPI00082D1D62|nr:anaerobic sulfatase maturase [Amphibacillus sediminis]